MNDFVASSVCWTIATSWRTSPWAIAGSRASEPLDDLGLEDDVRQALGRAVVHRPGDVAAEVLLGAEDDPGDAGRRHVAPRRRRHRRPAASAAVLELGAALDGDAEVAGKLGDRIAEAGRASCACPRGRRPGLSITDARRVRVTSWALSRDHVRRTASPPAARPSFSCGLGPLQLVALGLGPGLGDEHVDLGQLADRAWPACDRGARGDVGEGAPAPSSCRAGTRPRSVDQSSGIRIQPWRIA